MEVVQREGRGGLLENKSCGEALGRLAVVALPQEHITQKTPELVVLWLVLQALFEVPLSLTKPPLLQREVAL